MRPPVVPGKKIERERPACAACGHVTAYLKREVREGVDMQLCTSLAACTHRFRGGKTWDEFMADVRKETAAYERAE